MIAKLFAMAIISLFQLIAGLNVSLADPWNVNSVAFSDDGFDVVLAITLARGVVVIGCSTAWTSLQRPDGATPTDWMNCADQSLKFRIVPGSFVSTKDFGVHFLSTEFAKKRASNVFETLPIYETLVHLTNVDAPGAFDGSFFSSQVILDCNEARDKHFSTVSCSNKTGSEILKAFTINKVVEALHISNVTTKNDKRTLWQFDFIVEDTTQFGLATPKVHTKCHVDWPTAMPPETITADHPAFCEDKSISFYLTANDRLDINNGFTLHVDHILEEVGEYRQFPVPMGLWFTVSGDAEFKPETDKCDERKGACSYATENELRMNLTYSVSPTKP